VTFPEPSLLRIERFDPQRHERESFSCGAPTVDNFFRRTANKLAQANHLRVYVLVGDDRTVIGFYAVNAHSVSYTELPAAFARNRPGHGQIPAAYIAMIGVDRRHAGKGYGGDLLVDALKRIATAADAIGLAVVMLDILDDGDSEAIARRRRLYQSYGFQPLSSNPLRHVLSVATIRAAFARS
jgi:ribosomal protein S18 acetylase RimI-like enzyme